MRPSFVIMMVIGLILMGIFWWFAWEAEEEKVAAEALVKGCASNPAECPADLPECITAYGLASGVCSTKCSADNQCPEGWCCPQKLATMPDRLCVPKQQCKKLQQR